MRVLVPSRFDDLLVSLFGSMEAMDEGSTRYVIVGDNGLSHRVTLRWPEPRYLPVGNKPFVYSQVINHCAEIADGEDLMIIGDDAIIKTPGWKSKILKLFASWPDLFGMLNLAESPQNAPIVEAVGPLAFVATLIPWHVWREIGPLDERFVGYGYDDIDFCFRLHRARYKIGTTSAVEVEHRGTQSFNRVWGSTDVVEALRRLNREIFKKKWGVELDSPFKPWSEIHVPS